MTQADFDRASFRVAGKKATRAEWQAAMPARIGKHRVSIMLDAPIIAHFRAAAGERDYQTLINQTLRRVMEGERVITVQVAKATHPSAWTADALVLKKVAEPS